MTAIIYQGDARSLPLPDASVDLVVTSPPYYALRSYTDGGEHYEGQIGSEETPAEYIAALIDCTREWARVLKPTGSIFVDLGDKYGRPGGGADRNPRTLAGAGRGSTARMRTPSDGGGRDKCLMLLPERYRIACVDELGLIARAVIVWDKTNPLPESAADRVRRSHEDWVHLTLQEKYFSGVDEIRETPAGTAHPRRRDGGRSPKERSAVVAGVHNGHATGGQHPLGRLPGSVRAVSSQPLIVPDHIGHAVCCGGIARDDCDLGLEHYAAFPAEWPAWIIQGWSTTGNCTACGESRRPVAVGGRSGDGSKTHKRERRVSSFDWAAWKESTPRTITGYACACTPYTDHPAVGSTRRRSYSPGLRDNNAQGTYGRHQAGEYERVGPWREYHLGDWAPAPTLPAVVLDPFGGTGTTALAASTLGRVGISVDMSADYCRIARWRTSDPAQRAKVLGVPKPPVEVVGQLDLLAELGGVG